MDSRRERIRAITAQAVKNKHFLSSTKEALFPMKYGYRPRINQPLMLAHFSVKMPSQKDINIDILEDSLKYIFDIDCGSYLTRKTTDIYALLIERYLLLSNVLQSFSGIPSFYTDTVHKYSLDDRGNIGFDAYIPYLALTYINMRDRLYQASSCIINLILEKKADQLYLYLDELYEKTIKEYKTTNRQNDSTIPILEGAYSQNIPFIHLCMNVFQLGLGSKSILLQTSAVDEDSSIGAGLSHNKLFSKNILQNMGCPVPAGFYVEKKDNLITHANKLSFPVVLKPIDRDRSEGVTTNIHGNDQLISAYNEVLKFSKNILIEEHVKGDVFRIALIHNNLIYVVARKPKGVFGDGEQTIEALIDNANHAEAQKAPWLRLKPFPKDQAALECLVEQSLGLQTVLDKGQYAYLRRIQSNQDGGVVENYTESIHPANIMLAKRISNMFRLKSIGIDFITTDITRPWFETGGKILELNFSPLVADRFQSWGHKSSKIFASSCFPLGARIPVDLYVGGPKAWDDAKKGLQKLKNKQINAYMTDNLATFDSNQEKIEMVTQGFYHRIQALLTDPTLDHLIVIIRTNELLETGMPFDQISNLFIVNHDLKEYNSDESLSEQKVRGLIDYLSLFLNKNELTESTKIMNENNN